MLGYLKKLIRNYFGYSKSETNGFLVLIPLLILGLFVPQLFKYHLKSKGQIDDSFYEEEFRKWVAENDRKIRLKDTIKVLQSTFDFDPNLATVEELKSLGFKEKIAKRINSYRAKGGQFRSKDDLNKIYGISKKRIAELDPHIKITDFSDQKKKTFKNSSKTVRTEKPNPETPKVNINLASQYELIEVYGVGPVLSERILKYRNLLGGFHSWQQLNEVYGLKVETITRIREHFYLDESVISQTDLNLDSIRLLAKHPYISYSLAKIIIAYREQHGDFLSIRDLKKIKIVNDSTYDRLAPYLFVSNDISIQ